MALASERPAAVAPLSLVLLCSGACAIVFQLVWIRELRLVFGATTASSAAVLAIFMAGLGLGNAVFGKRADRSPRPLRMYGLLEAGIALSAAVSPWLIDVTRSLYIAAGGQDTLGAGVATAVRLLASAVILGSSTFLMGGTLPAAARAVATDDDVERRRVALIYGLNTLGAVLGAGLATFVLLERFGNRAALWSACSMNVALAAVACLWSRRLTQPAAIRAKRRDPRAVPPITAIQPGNHLVLVGICSAVVGFVFFLMEIAWYRMLGPLLGGTTYTFGLILCVALLGIGLGGALFAAAARWIKPSLSLLAATCAMEALLLAVPFHYADRIAIWVLHQQADFAGTFANQVWNWFQVAFVVIWPAALVAGFQFPLLIATAGAGRGDVGKHVGWTFAANTAGAIAGSLTGGFWLLPLLTAPGVWRMAVLALAGAALSIAVLGRQWRRPWLGAAGIAAALAVWAVVLPGPSAVWRHSGIGAGRAILEGTGRNAEQHFMNRVRRDCIWEAEGRESSVAIATSDGLSLLVNGKSDGNSYTDAGTQIGLGLLGPLLHDAPASAVVIGLGTGESAGWLADVDGMTAVDVIELEPVTVRMAELCAAVNRNVLDNPKVHLHFNDGREFLLSSRTQYDLAVSEPSNPYRAGVASLYTREFYEAVSQRLNAKGLFVQWLQGYEVDDDTVGVVLATLRAVFPHVEIWRGKAGDLILVCGKSALSHDAAAIARRLRQPVIAEGLLRGWRVNDVEGVLAHYVCGPATVDGLLAAGDYPINTDERNLLEYAFARSVGRTTKFSVEELQAVAVQSGDEGAPLLSPAGARKLNRRRLAMHLYLGRGIPVAENLSEDDRLLAEAYTLYLAGRYADAAARWKRIEDDATCPIESVVCAHTLAEAGLTPPQRLLEAVRRNCPTEAAAIEAIGLWQRGRSDDGAQHMIRALKTLHDDPWPMAPVVAAILKRAGDVESSAAVAALHAQLESPFAVYRLEQHRQLLRCVISEKLGRSEAIAALAPLEPNVPWREWFLRDRAQAYEAAEHPLAKDARRDLERFHAWEAE